MIVDKIENAGQYSNLGDRIQKSLDFIKKTDLKKLQPGRYDIDGDNIFALISEYQTKAESEGKLEAHRKYIDVQCVINGEELIGYAPLSNPSFAETSSGGQEILEHYSEEKDIVFFNGEKVFIKVKEGMFAIFFPEDAHMPGINVKGKSSVKKLVIKVKAD